MALRFPDGLDETRFLRDYWQKQPLVMRAAFAPGKYPLDADEIAGLALQPDVEGRLVLGAAHGEYRVSESPFAESELTGLPHSDWTLLVQDVEKHWPELRTFCDLFDFIPRWRFDDLMISVAAPGGGVGPHIDQYDVFLCQHTGNRRWQFGRPGHYVERKGSSLRQIEGFRAEETTVLEPGDILYLPPGVPHDGVATSLCSTWSVGFRAPSRSDLLKEFGIQISDSIDPDRRYSDPDLLSDEADAGRIGPRALARFARLLGPNAPRESDSLARLLGRFLTTPKTWLLPEAPHSPLTMAELRERFESGEVLLVHGMALFAQVTLAESAIFFASGAAIGVPSTVIPLVEHLCAHQPLARDEFKVLSEEGLQLLLRLYNAGQLMFNSDYHDV